MYQWGLDGFLLCFREFVGKSGDPGWFQDLSKEWLAFQYETASTERDGYNVAIPNAFGGTVPKPY